MACATASPGRWLESGVLPGPGVMPLDLVLGGLEQGLELVDAAGDPCLGGLADIELGGQFLEGISGDVGHSGGHAL